MTEEAQSTLDSLDNLSYRNIFKLDPTLARVGGMIHCCYSLCDNILHKRIYSAPEQGEVDEKQMIATDTTKFLLFRLSCERLC